MVKTRKVLDGQRGLILAIFAASFFVNLLILTAPLYMLQLFSRVMSSGSIPTLVALTTGAAIALFFLFVFDTLRQRLVARLGTRIEARLGPNVLRGLIRARTPEEGLDGHPVRDLATLRGFVTSPVLIAMLDAPFALAFLVVIYLMHPILGLVATVGLLVLLGLGILSEAMGRGPTREADEAAEKANATVNEILRNNDIVKAMGKGPASIDRWKMQSFAALLFGTQATDRVATMASLAKAVRMALQIAVLCAGVVLVIRGHVSPGVMIAGSILLARAAAPVEQSIAGWKGLMQARGAVKRLNTLLARVSDGDPPMELPEPAGHLSVENATVILPGIQNPLLFDVSFALEPGQSVGIIGPSGAGKTTLARALVGLVDLARGHVRLDGAALTDWPEDQLGRYVGYLPQRVELFEGTIAENIAMMDPYARPSDIVAAAKLAEVHDLILKRPGGYNAPVGPMGSYLSAGQRQRIGLARAFFGERRLIVLDEPNANLDPEGEEALARAVERVTRRGAVVVIVTHRMNILRRVSHVALMKDGQLHRFGPSRDILNEVLGAMGAQGADPAKVAQLRRPGSDAPRAAISGGKG